jgi:hypothetical protein
MSFENPSIEYLSTGANRHTAVGDWDSDILAFGADINVCLWQTEVSRPALVYFQMAFENHFCFLQYYSFS